MIISKPVNRIFIFLIFINLILFNPEEGFSRITNGLSGRYINYSFLEKLPDMIPGSIPNYCLEINFTGTDSAELYNGFEEFRLAYKGDGEDLVFLNAVQGKDLLFKLMDDQIFLEDSIWTGVSPGSVFKKVSDDNYLNDHKWIFEKYLNERMIAGNYFLNESKNASGHEVSFNEDGKVTGLHDFAEYAVCFSGDCTGETDPVANTITFKKNSGDEITYAFKFKDKNSILFYDIAPPTPDIKGERQILEMSFALEKLNSK